MECLHWRLTINVIYANDVRTAVQRISTLTRTDVNENAMIIKQLTVKTADVYITLKSVSKKRRDF